MVLNITNKLHLPALGLSRKGRERFQFETKIKRRKFQNKKQVERKERITIVDSLGCV